MNTNTIPPPLGGSPYVGLTDAECFALARTASHLPGAWYVQRDEDDQGHASVGLVPDDGGTDDSVPVFLLWREDGLLRLSCGQGELYADFGIQVDVQAAIDAIRCILEGVIPNLTGSNLRRLAGAGLNVIDHGEQQDPRHGRSPRSPHGFHGRRRSPSCPADT